jgi:hypothetical protein
LNCLRKTPEEVEIHAATHYIYIYTMSTDHRDQMKQSGAGTWQGTSIAAFTSGRTPLLTHAYEEGDPDDIPITLLRWALTEATYSATSEVRESAGFRRMVARRLAVSLPVFPKWDNPRA